MDLDVIELNDCSGRQVPVPGWTPLHFWGDIFCSKTGKETSNMHSDVIQLNGCFGRQNPIPGWALLHFGVDTFLQQNR